MATVYDYECPLCEEGFSTTLLNGITDCPNCEESLRLVNGKSAYVNDDADDYEDIEGDEDIEEDGDDKDFHNE
jgi:hypothetical protein